jgi:hypothetical protein
MTKQFSPWMLGILVIASIAVTACSSGIDPEDIPALEDRITRDYEKRELKYMTLEERDELNFWVLEKGQCPSELTEIIVIELPASGGYTDIANTGYYCPSTNVYWVWHVQGAFIGSGGDWLGPYDL